MHFGCFLFHLILIICCIHLSASAPSPLNLDQYKKNDTEKSLYSEAGKITINSQASQQPQLEPKTTTNLKNDSSIAVEAANNKKISLTLSGSDNEQKKDVKSNKVSQTPLNNLRPDLPPLPNGVDTRHNSLADSGSSTNKNDVSFLSNVTNHEGDGDSRSVKKDLNNIESGRDDEIFDGYKVEKQQQQTISQTEGQSYQKVPNSEVENITGFTEAAGVIFVLSLLVIAFIMYRTCK